MNVDDKTKKLIDEAVDVINEVAGMRGPDTAIIITTTNHDGLCVQGMIGDWSKELNTDNKLIDFKNTIRSMYNTGVWL